VLERIGRLSELTSNLYFYINNPLVMKAILFCDEPYFRYIHEEGGNFCSGHKDHLFLANK